MCSLRNIFFLTFFKFFIVLDMLSHIPMVLSETLTDAMMETFLWSLLPLSQTNLGPFPPKCSNIKSGNSAKMRFEIVIICLVIGKKTMPKKPHWAHHFDKSFAPRKSQFKKKYQWQQGYWLALKVKKLGVIHTHKPKTGLLIKVLKKKKTIGHTFKQSGRKHSTKTITAIWRYGHLETIHPGKPSKTTFLFGHFLTR